MSERGKAMYAIWKRNYPQCDINMSEEDKAPFFSSKREAEEYANKWIEILSDEAWNGHWLYKAKFYVEKVTD